MSRPLTLHANTTVIAEDSNRNVLAAFGPEVPEDAAAGYATGCLFIHTDGGDGTALYANEGDTDSADFNPVAVGSFNSDTATVVGATGAVIAQDGSGNILMAHGATVPVDATAGYAIGCLFLHTDGGDGTALYVNEGTAISADFNAITVA